VRYLSGGNQQKIILARELHGKPELIIACQPTRGLDIGAEEFTHNLLVDQKCRGVGILLISADLEQLMKLSDRIAVIFDGRITGLMEKMTAIDLSGSGSRWPASPRARHEVFARGPIQPGHRRDHLPGGSGLILAVGGDIAKAFSAFFMGHSSVPPITSPRCWCGPPR
jgi:energy-coupling factor transporter ATP-binding protein EcfA2